MFGNTHSDFVAFGDTTVDDFIRLKDASVHCSVDRDACEICMRFGDKIPFISSTKVYGVGNSANAAVSAARLGLSSSLVAAVGDDEAGRAVLGALSGQGVSTRFIAKERGKATNYHYVLWYEDERTILINHEAYAYAFPKLSRAPKVAYLSSYGDSADGVYRELLSYLAAHPETLLAFQPGTTQIKETEKFKPFYARTGLFVANREEYARITKLPKDNPRALMEALKVLGPTRVVMTDGPRGLYALDESGSAWFLPPYPDPKPPLQRTGAGDATASTIAAALALGVPFAEALRWGPVNAMSVVQGLGAQAGLLKKDALLALLAKAPAEYALAPLQ